MVVIFLILGILAMGYGQIVYEPVPVSFITPFSQKVGTDYVSNYLIPLCGGCQFDGQFATVSINLANHKWLPFLGDIIYLNITDVQGHPIANNIDPNTKEPITDFKFQYQSNYGDLYMTSKTGTGASYVFTIYLRFDYNKTMAKVGKKYHQNCEMRHRMTAFETWTMDRLKVKSDVITMIPIFKTDTVNSVDPDTAVFYRLDYCFGKKTEYNVTITTLAVLPTSGFTTYVCTKNYKPAPYFCDVKTPFRDTSGAGANFINVKITNKDFGPMYVIIRGEGRYSLKNLFNLAGSSYH